MGSACCRVEKRQETLKGTSKNALFPRWLRHRFLLLQNRHTIHPVYNLRARILMYDVYTAVLDSGSRLRSRQLLLHCSTTSIHGGVPPVTHMDVGNAKAMLEHRWPSMQSCARCFLALTKKLLFLEVPLRCRCAFRRTRTREETAFLRIFCAPEGAPTINSS